MLEGGKSEMKAVVLNGVTKAKEIKLVEIPVPEVVSGWALVKIKAFGLNHSEQILRLDEIRANYIKKPIVPGIECAGEIADPSDTGFKKGQKVIALMGGMGRSFNGSYAEYALIPKNHIFAVSSDMPWEELGAIPETFFTAWGSLFCSLNLKKEDVLLVRGGTCALGYAAIQIAKALGCRVIATSHKEEKLHLLTEIGADEAASDEGKLDKEIKVTKALELVGAKTLRDTFLRVKKGGVVCYTGILGGVYYLNGFDPIKDIPSGVYLTGFFSNSPTKEIVDEMTSFISAHKIKPKIGAVFPFSDIGKALIAQDYSHIDGKIVILV